MDFVVRDKMVIMFSAAGPMAVTICHKAVRGLGGGMNVIFSSLFGIAIGAVFQYLFTRRLEEKRLHRDVLAKAYADYLLCVSEHANLRPDRHSPDGLQLGVRTADAKCRISLYGSPKVISAFANFERLGAAMNTAEQRSAFVNMIWSMRKDVRADNVVVKGDLETVLLGAPHLTQ